MMSNATVTSSGHLQALYEQVGGPRPKLTTPFIAGRYPNTYAADQLRSQAVGMDLSRGEASRMIRQYAERAGADEFELRCALADEYLAELGIVKPDGFTPAR